MRLGLGNKMILDIYHPDSMELFDVSNSLQKVSSIKLMDPSWSNHWARKTIPFSQFKFMYRFSLILFLWMFDIQQINWQSFHNSNLVNHLPANSWIPCWNHFLNLESKISCNPVLIVVNKSMPQDQNKWQSDELNLNFRMNEKIVQCFLFDLLEDLWQNIILLYQFSFFDWSKLNSQLDLSTFVPLLTSKVKIQENFVNESWLNPPYFRQSTLTFIKFYLKIDGMSPHPTIIERRAFYETLND